ncbi:MAG TPA: response regulator [Pyrinomonadaceae bacterium]|nr:response regulator [Pyrinomonadaceae bacterium]
MGKKILIVDDEPDSRKLLKTFLEMRGYDVLEATDGYDAVEKAVEEHPDMVIMDMAMPMMDGVNSARTMRLHDELRDMPIVGLTAFGDFYEPRAFAAGCTHVLHKPVDFRLLEPVVSRYFH